MSDQGDDPIVDPDIDSQEENPEQSAAHSFLHPKVIAPIFVAYLALGLSLSPLYGIEIDRRLVQNYGLPLLGAFIGLASLWYAYLQMHKLRGTAEQSFIDIDREAGTRRRQSELLHRLRAEVESLRDQAETVSRDQIEALVRSATNSGKERELPSGFKEYFSDIKDVLEAKAANADAKASILLDKGVAYSRFGIIFFIGAIIAWQLVAWRNEFTTAHIYGVLSTSLLFIFIEFLSAWFLRQYRHFVDTSTYLMKVKAIFDRYMLTYLAIESPVAEGDSLASVLGLLRDEIRWPDDYLMKEPDVSFAREGAQSLAEVAKSLRSD